MKRRTTAAVVPAALFGFFLSQAVAQQSEPPLTPRERMMLDRIEQLEKRLTAIEAKTAPAPAPSIESPPAAPPTEKDSVSLPGFIAGTTINFDFDGYFEYNFNRPIGRVNLLRAYDI